MKPWLLRGFIFVACLSVTSAHAQRTPPTWPGLSDPYTNLVVHDLGHSAASIAVAEALRLLPGEHNITTRYLIAAVWFPVAHEIVDQFRWPRHKWQESWKDIVTYQAAWVVPLIQWKRYVEAVCVGVVVLGFIHWRYQALRPATIRIHLRL